MILVGAGSAGQVLGTGRRDRSWAWFSLYEQGRDLEHGEEDILSVLGHSRAHLTPILTQSS